MKRILCILLSVCVALSLAACGKTPAPPATVETEPAGDAAQPTENQTAAQPQAPTESPTPTESQAPTESQSPTQTTEPQTGDKTEAVRLLTLEKSLYSRYEWTEDHTRALVRSEHSCVTLGQESADAYPEMAEVLRQKAAMQENAMGDEFDNLVSFAGEMLDRDNAETLVSTLDVQVCRADSLIISLRSDSDSHYGQIENYRAFHASNYDPETGMELTLDDVATVNNDLAKAVEKEFITAMWAGDFYSETAVEDYFANTPYDGFCWTMDYFGLTFYFPPGDLSDDGMLTATVSFAEYPELFNEKYLAAPTEYAIEMPLDISFFAELDADDALEAISVSGWYNEERNRYMDYGIYTDTDGQYYYEECDVYDLHPYYVRTADGNYVYLFCEDYEDGRREMRLVVLGLNADGSVTKRGERNLSPSWLSDNQFIVPADPDWLILDDADAGTEMVVFTVGANGMPVK